MHLADAFIQSDLYSGYTFLFYQYVCSLGIVPTTFCAPGTQPQEQRSVTKCEAWGYVWNSVGLIACHLSDIYQYKV